MAARSREVRNQLLSPERPTRSGGFAVTGSANDKTEGLTYPRLLGVRIEEAPPIADLFFGLEPGLTVLYGRNGASKTRLLDAIAESIVGGDSGGRRTFVFEWPALPNGLWNEIKWVDIARWKAIPGNPWNFEPEAASGVELMGGDAQGMFEVGADRSGRKVGPDEAIERLRAAVLDEEKAAGSAGSGGWLLAIRVLLSASPQELEAIHMREPGDADEDVLRLNAQAALEVARAARCAIRRGRDRRGVVGELLTLGRIDEDTPAIRSLLAAVDPDGEFAPTSNDPQGAWFAQCLDSRQGLLLQNAQSVIDNALGRPPAPVWFGDTYLSQPGSTV